MDVRTVENMVAESGYTFPSDWLTDDHHWNIAERIHQFWLSLPVEERMRAMGMVERSNSHRGIVRCWTAEEWASND